MNYLQIVLLLFALASTQSGLSQSMGEIMWGQVATATEDSEVCYLIQIKSVDAEDNHLKGQNYRFYYNASQLRFVRQSAESLLPRAGYQDLKVVQHFYNSNASGFGSLDFDATLGFVNLSIGDLADSDVRQELTREWQPTAQLCFKKNKNLSSYDLVWARENLTSGYATAYTQLSIHNDNNMGKMELIFHDQRSNSKEVPAKVAIK